MDTAIVLAADPSRQPPTSGGKLGFIRLAAGVTARQAVILVAVSIINDLAYLLIPIMQPYILQDRLHLEPTMYGRVAGTLATVQNVAMIVSVVFFGALGDRVGRRPLMIGAMAMMGFVCLLYPFTATLTVAVLLNFLMGIGISAFYAAAGAYIFAYPAEKSRGSFVSMLIVTQRIASSAFIGVLGTRLPKFLTDLGFSLMIAGGVVFWLLAVLCICGIFLARSGFTDRPAAAHAVKLKLISEARALLTLIGEVFRHARQQPRFGMLLFLSCAFRADLVVVYTFLSLWVVAAARTMGIDSGQAMQTTGSLLVVLTISNLIATIFCGYVADKANRSGMLLVALAGSGLAFLSPLLVSDTANWLIYFVVTLIGVSEGISAIASQTLLGEETPPHLRGSVAGAYTVIGMTGAVIINSVGGILFDRTSYVAPFMMVAIINLICLALCLLPGPQSFGRSLRSAGE